MTLYGWGNPRYFPRLPAATIRYFDVAPDACVLAHCHWQREPWSRPTLIALHGLNGPWVFPTPAMYDPECWYWDSPSKHQT